MSLILCIRTDQPTASLSLFSNQEPLGEEVWQAHRQLAETIHNRIDKLLKTHDKSLSEVTGIICFKGPGSFTGLRIGMSVANALAYGLSIPVVSAQGEDWVKKGLEGVKAGDNEVAALPEYGAPVHITQQKK